MEEEKEARALQQQQYSEQIMRVTESMKSEMQHMAEQHREREDRLEEKASRFDYRETDCLTCDFNDIGGERYSIMDIVKKLNVEPHISFAMYAEGDLQKQFIALLIVSCHIWVPIQYLCSAH